MFCGPGVAILGSTAPLAADRGVGTAAGAPDRARSSTSLTAISAQNSEGGGHPFFDVVHHIGVSVADLDRSIAFWTRMLAVPGRDRRVLEGPQLGTLLGYPRARVDSCWFDLPGGVALELLQYLEPVGEANDPALANPGNVHVCLRVSDIDAAHAHAVAAGATPVSAEPIEVRAGPYAGTRLACLRDPDGVTLELLARP